MRIALLVLLFGASTAFANPLEVTVKPASTTWKPKQKVEVTLIVRNPSKAKLSFEVMGCSWGDSWKSSDPELTWLPWGCDKNAPTKITLESNKSHEWKLEMFATDKAKLGDRELVMTFTALQGKPNASYPVTIKVAR